MAIQVEAGGSLQYVSMQVGGKLLHTWEKGMGAGPYWHASDAGSCCCCGRASRQRRVSVILLQPSCGSMLPLIHSLLNLVRGISCCSRPLEAGWSAGRGTLAWTARPWLAACAGGAACSRPPHAACLPATRRPCPALRPPQPAGRCQPCSPPRCPACWTPCQPPPPPPPRRCRRLLRQNRTTLAPALRSAATRARLP